MTKSHKKLPMRLIQESFDIDESSPTYLRWKHRPISHFESDRRFRQANARCAGKPAGNLSYSRSEKRYSGTVYLAGELFSLSRIVFALANGYDPGSRDVDHIDGDRSNNNPSNLRAVTHAQNCINRISGKTPASGVTGVYWNKKLKRYLVFIRANGKSIYLGCFSSLDSATTARRDGEVKYHGEFVRVP